MISLIRRGQILKALFCDCSSLTRSAMLLWFICPCQGLNVSQDNKKNHSGFLFKTQVAFKPRVWIKLLLKHKDVLSLTSFPDYLKPRMCYCMQYSPFVGLFGILISYTYHRVNQQSLAHHSSLIFPKTWLSADTLNLMPYKREGRGTLRTHLLFAAAANLSCLPLVLRSPFHLHRIPLICH